MIIVNRKSKNKFFNKGGSENDYTNPGPGNNLTHKLTYNDNLNY